MRMRTAAVTIAAAVALGLVGQSARDLHGPDAALLFALGGPWVVTAFAVAALTRSAVAGTVACALSVPVYYGVMLLVEGRGYPGYAFSMTVLWGAAALACGALFGWLGATARERSGRRRGVAVAILGGTLAGEAALFLALHSRAGSPVLVAELVAGAVLVGAAAWPGRARALAAATGAAGVAAVADGALRFVMRAQGWGG